MSLSLSFFKLKDQIIYCELENSSTGTIDVALIYSWEANTNANVEETFKLSIWQLMYSRRQVTNLK